MIINSRVYKMSLCQMRNIRRPLVETLMSTWLMNDHGTTRLNHPIIHEMVYFSSSSISLRCETASTCQQQGGGGRVAFEVGRRVGDAIRASLSAAVTKAGMQGRFSAKIWWLLVSRVQPTITKISSHSDDCVACAPGPNRLMNFLQSRKLVLLFFLVHNCWDRPSKFYKKKIKINK